MLIDTYNLSAIDSAYDVKAFTGAEEFLRQHDPDIPGCLILDLHLPGMDGFGIQDALGARSSRPVIFLTGHGDIPASVRAVKAGAIDFLTKPVGSETLLASIEQALEQDRQTRQHGAEQRSIELCLSHLTPRERQVLSFVVAGRLNKQIAAELGTVEKTVKVHRGRMMAKMGVRTVADLVRLVTLAGK